MPGPNPMSFIPVELQQRMFNALIDFLSEQAQKVLGDEVSARLKGLRSDAAFIKQFEAGLKRAVERFLKEYEAHDEDLTAAIADEPDFFKNEQVQKALLWMLKHPGTDLDEQRELLAASFATVLPTRRNRERVDQAVMYFLKCLTEELWRLPELQPIYSLQFQRMTAGKEFYTDLIQQSDWATLAVAISKNEILLDELYKLLSLQERERLNSQIDLLKALRTGNAKDEALDFEAVKVLMNAIVGRAGGTDLSAAGDVAVSGDVVGRDKITYANAPNIGESQQPRRVEAQFPTQPMIGRIESLYVQVKMPESSIGPDTRTRTMPMPFRADVSTGATLSTPFAIKVIAPGFRIHGGDQKLLRVPPDEDSPVLEFQLQCETDQAVKIQVEIYAESGFLGQIDLSVTPIAQQISLPSERMWIHGVFVLATLPNASASTSSW
jgi:hypothetical protein